MEKLIKHKGTHITISDEPIKVGDWVYWEEFDGEILQVQSMDADYIWFAEGKGCLRAENAYPPYKVLHKLADPVSCVDLNGDIMEECYKVEDVISATVSATPKLTLTQYEFLKNEVAKTQMEHPGAGYEDWRLGQAWFNELVAHLPQFEWIRTTKLDPFHRDEVLLDLFFHILDEEAYASWTHSDAYKKLHKEWVDKHPAVPVDTSGSELSDFLESSEEDDMFEPFKKVLNSKLMENETYMSPAGPTSSNEMPNGTPLPEEGAAVMAADYTPMQHVETTNVRLNFTTRRTPVESVKLLQSIMDLISSLDDVQVRNLEISRW